jgi:uncharacterized repeat protein (TIGR02543 family)
MIMMFQNCSKVTDLNLGHFNTSNVTNMYQMFSGCSSLTSLDISNFDTSAVTQLTNMFTGCTNLYSVKLGSNFRFDGKNITDSSLKAILPTPSGSVYTGKWIKAGNTSGALTPAELQNTHDGSIMSGTWLPELNGYAYAILTNAGKLIFFRSMTSYSDGIQTVTDIENNTLTGYVYSGIESWNIDDENDIPWLNNSTEGYNGYDINEVMFDDTQIIRPLSTAYWFQNFVSCLDMHLSGLDTICVTDMSHMFDGCITPVLDLSGFNTKNVTDMSYMFNRCWIEEDGIVSIDFTGWDTSNVTNMSHMFDTASYLENPDLSGFDTSNVTDMSEMFSCCDLGLTALDLSNFNTENVTDFSGMFEMCDMLETLDISGFNTSSATDMSDMFDNCNSLSSVELGADFKFKGNNIVDEDAMAILPTPTGSSYTGKWIKSGETTGALTPVALRDTYNGTMAGTWEWEEAHIIDITLNDNGGQNGSGTIYSNYGDGIYLTNNDGTLSNEMTTSANPVSIPTKTGYTVTFSANGGSSTGATGDTMTSSGVFGGYYDNSSTPVQMIDSTGHITASLTPTYTEATTLTASWSNGSITLPTPTRTGYTCTGWYTGNTKKGDAGDSYTPTAAETLTAGWQINTYALSVTNTITGSMGDKTKEFSFTLALTGTDLPSTLDFTKNGTAGTATLTNNECNFTLVHNDEITFNVPYNTGYTITETNDGYAVAKTNDTGTIATSPINVTFTNTLNKTIETGVENRNQLIFMLLLISFAAIIITVEERKRRKIIENRIENTEDRFENSEDRKKK